MKKCVGSQQTESSKSKISLKESKLSLPDFLEESQHSQCIKVKKITIVPVTLPGRNSTPYLDEQRWANLFASKLSQPWSCGPVTHTK